jgi:hypothetical protein
LRTGKEITEEIAQIIENSPIETVEIRSVLTCESKKGVCANATDVTLHPVEWFRKVKLLV